MNYTLIHPVGISAESLLT